ncbi:TonB-dependent receptor plug domain-containing protein [Paracoccus ravus]|uniref:TonB-dependent receptor plug domain-containing protein n=1 Tax=Paracoccus ravus TaxID=2447760 RepID=UPI00106E27F2|nr:Plug domain-containing protein [Paracoccus ravus]
MTICAPALAQQVETQVTETEALALAPVTLLADCQGTSTREVPASVSVMDGQEIRERRMNNMQELMRYTPGVLLQRNQVYNAPAHGLMAMTAQR